MGGRRGTGGGAAAAWALVAVGVVGVSLSAPLAAAVAAPALAIGFWRNAIGAAATAPYVALRHRPGLRGLPPDALRSAAVAGTWLALHFATWLSGLKLTSVTAATALVCTTPVWIVGWQLARRQQVPGRVLAGTALAMAGVLAITGVDAASSARAVTGDLLSLAGAVAGAGYVLAGERARRSASTGEYTLVAYTVCAALLLPACVLTGTQLTGWSGRVWLELAVLTVSAQLLGHSALNAALPKVGATALSLAILLEVPGATLIAWAWFGDPPPATVLPGAALMLAGLAVVIAAGRRPVEGPVDEVVEVT